MVQVRFCPSFSRWYPQFSWWNHHLPMVFLWFSYGFPMVFLWFSHGSVNVNGFNGGTLTTEPQGSVGAEARAVAQGWAAQIEAFGDLRMTTSGPGYIYIWKSLIYWSWCIYLATKVSLVSGPGWFHDIYIYTHWNQWNHLMMALIAIVTGGFINS